jgi:D-glycero-D-manno-heptose 1,7-bisphosphate phosphatase
MRAVFLDRDGTVVEERGYVSTPEMLVLLPGAARAIADLQAHGWKVFIASNQASVAKGLITEDDLAGIHLRLMALLSAEGAALDGVYYCPHHPEGTVSGYAMECDCRKPRPGLLERAASEHGLDLSECVMIGDSARDVEAGRAAGTATVLVRSGHDRESASADHVAEDLAAAVRWVLSRG